MRGALLVAMCAALAALAGTVAQGLAQWGGWVGVFFESVALKMSFSLRDLASSCGAVSRALGRRDLVEARRLVGYHLVSRRTAELDEAHVASAAIESAGENLTDAFVAPLMFYLAFGLAGAYVYRTVNTADAMIGYRDGHLEYLGKAAARLDDLFNLIPALAALAIAACAGLVGADARGAGRTVLAGPREDGESERRLDHGGRAGDSPREARGLSARGGGFSAGVRLILVAALGLAALMVCWLLLLYRPDRARFFLLAGQTGPV